MISNESFVGLQSREACRSTHAGPSVTIEDTADVVFRAPGWITLGEEFVVLTGGELELELSTPTACL